jgi:hypothetical protein
VGAVEGAAAVLIEQPSGLRDIANGRENGTRRQDVGLELLAIVAGNPLTRRRAESVFGREPISAGDLSTSTSHRTPRERLIVMTRST